MNRDELTALRDAIGVLLTWPDSVRDQVAAWLKPEAVLRPGNGLDPHPPLETAAESVGVSPRQAKVRRPASAFAAKTAERKLLSAMREAPGASVITLARSIGGNRSSVGEQLRKLALTGAIEKASDGHWRLKAEETEFAPYVGAVAELTAAPEAERSDGGPEAGRPRWIRPLADYERRTTSDVHGARYG